MSASYKEGCELGLRFLLAVVALTISVMAFDSGWRGVDTGEKPARIASWVMTISGAALLCFSVIMAVDLFRFTKKIYGPQP